jgi:raffinose/stachyose/melibiose transport system permease protein
VRVPKAQRNLGYAVLAVASAIALVPLLGVLDMALSSPDETGGTLSIGSLHFGNFKTVWTLGQLSQGLATSFFISISATTLTVLLAVPAGYALASFKIRFRAFLFIVLLSGLMLPNESLIIPLFFDLRSVGLGDTTWSVVMVETALSLAFGTFWMRAFFLDAPSGLVEAARIDGANSFTILTRILAPLAVPQILALVVLVFVWTWNDLLVPLVLLSGGRTTTAPMALAIFQGQHATNYAYLSAAAILTAFPVVLVYIALQRSFSRGIVSGAIRE